MLPNKQHLIFTINSWSRICDFSVFLLYPWSAATIAAHSEFP